MFVTQKNNVLVNVSVDILYFYVNQNKTDNQVLLFVCIQTILRATASSDLYSAINLYLNEKNQ